jgi:hypothetical protein
MLIREDAVRAREAPEVQPRYEGEAGDRLFFDTPRGPRNRLLWIVSRDDRVPSRPP